MTKVYAGRLKNIVAALILIQAVPHASAAEAEVHNAPFRIIDEYCSDCHNLEDYSGGLSFELIDRQQAHTDAAIWEKVIRKINAGMMPPPGKERPAEHELADFIVSLEESIDAHAASSPQPGAPLLRRLNRTEYQNVIRDLLDLPINTADLMPADDSSGGFDNVGNVLSISPALLEAYISTAGRVSRLAIGDMSTVASTLSYRGSGQSQARHLEGLALGTRGGISVEHVFPLDAEYEISIARSGANGAFALTPFGAEDPVELVVDGERVALLQAQDRGMIRLPLKAGLHKLEAAYLPMTPGLGVDDLHSVWASSTSITNLAIHGPVNPAGRGDTASRRKIFTCYPDSARQEEICAEQILRQLATRAFRKPVNQESLDILLRFYRKGRENGDFDTGIAYGLTRLLSDPQFIFRFEAEPENLPGGAVFAVDDYELATRLAFFLWSSIPDDRLLHLAAKGDLSKAGSLQEEVQRMLADPKAQSLVSNFATQWLSLNKLATINPVSLDFDNDLRAAMLQETLLMFGNVLKENSSIIDFLDADYTFVNERLARHYDIKGIRGSHFRKVDLAESSRRGLLGHASILTITSAPNRTSPVIRGTWVLENLLGTPPPSPPPGVETNLDASVGSGVVGLTVREQLERHRADPSCAGCHNVIDPLGYALENFDAVGKWRDKLNAMVVNTESTLWDGSTLHGPDGLREMLLTRQDLFVDAFIEKLMTYALGRRVEYFDMPAVREVRAQAEADDFALGAIVMAIVNSPGFRMRVKADSAQQESTPANNTVAMDN